MPINAITNGVHHLTWVHRDLLDLLEAPSGSPSESDGYDWNALERVDSKTIWALKRRMREDLISMTRSRLAASSANRGMTGTGSPRRSIPMWSPSASLGGCRRTTVDLDAARSGSAEGLADR